MCWVALDRAEAGRDPRGPGVGGDATADEIRADILEHGVRDGVLRQHFDTEALDASTPLAAIFGFLPGNDETLRNSVEAIADDLTEDGFVLRYRTDETDDGMSGKEGSFLICSFWLVSALAIIGNQQGARDPMEEESERSQGRQKADPVEREISPAACLPSVGHRVRVPRRLCALWPQRKRQESDSVTAFPPERRSKPLRG